MKKICPLCETENDEDAIFCKECNEPLYDPSIYDDLENPYTKPQTEEEIIKKAAEKSKAVSDYFKSSFFNSIETLKKNGSFGEIIQMSDIYLKNQNPNPLVKAEIWNEMGYAYKIIDDNHKAVEMFKKTLEIDKEHLDASEGLAQTYIKLKDYDSAIKWLQKSAKHFRAAIKVSKIVKAHKRVSYLESELNTIETILNALKEGYRPDDSYIDEVKERNESRNSWYKKAHKNPCGKISFFSKDWFICLWKGERDLWEAWFVLLIPALPFTQLLFPWLIKIYPGLFLPFYYIIMCIQIFWWVSVWRCAKNSSNTFLYISRGLVLISVLKYMTLWFS